MCISLANVTEEVLDLLREEENVAIPESRWTSWKAAVLRATSSELRFVELKRQEIWSAVYQSPTGFLELSLHTKQSEWRMYAFPEADEPANAEIRQILQSPIGRFSCSGDLLQGSWQFALPCDSSIPVKIQGIGELVPSWETRLGLIGLNEEFKNKMVYSNVKVTVGSDDITKLDRDISGTYQLLEKCGTANGALHKKIDTETSSFLLSLCSLILTEQTTLKIVSCFLSALAAWSTKSADPSFVNSIQAGGSRPPKAKRLLPVICHLDGQSSIL